MTTVQRLSIEDVRAIAELAKLDLSDEELSMYAEQLSQILGYFQRLQEVDTTHVQIRDSVIPLTTVLRDEQIEAALPPQEAVSNAAEAEENQFKVRAVLGND